MEPDWKALDEAWAYLVKTVPELEKRVAALEETPDVGLDVIEGRLDELEATQEETP